MKKKLLFIAIMCGVTLYTQTRIVFSTIDTAGFYQLADDVTNQITINVSDVTLDLNGHRVSGGTNGIAIIAGLDRITIKNGMVDAVADGISVGAGASNIILENILAKESVRGISFTQVTNGLIKNCEMTLNTTGLELDNSHKIVIKDCIASCNTNAGYCLLSSTTNCFENCKALSTGEGNTNIFDNDVFGFVSADGYGNIFEGCIANSTQALTTTDFDSVIAGFAFRGSEECSKIIECEAANSVADEAGKTKPYGIFLEPQFGSVATFTSSGAGEATFGTSLARVKRSPDGQYIAMGLQQVLASSIGVVILKFEAEQENILEQVGSITYSPSSFALDVTAWSPDQRHIVVGGNLGTVSTQVEVYQFDPGSATSLVKVAETGTGSTADDAKAGAWSHDGRFLAISYSTGGSRTALRLYEFIESASALADRLVLVDSKLPLAQVLQVDWSFEDRYLVVANDSGSTVEVYRFTSGIGLLTLVDSVSVTSITTARWSPDGRYVAVGDDRATGGNDNLKIYEFDRSTETLSLLFSTDESGTDFISELVWSPDGKFLAMIANVGTAPGLFLYRFDPSSPSVLVQFDSAHTSESGRTVDWSPDGRYIASGYSASVSTPPFLFVDTAEIFPQKNIIKNNVVYCNSNLSPSFAQGVGISGSNIANMIMENKSYNNPQSYDSITNIFNGLSNSIPSVLQNVGIAGCVPPALTMDSATLTRILLEKICDIQTKLDFLL